MELKTQFEEIGSYPDHFDIGTVLARMLDGLGFRYYWSTEGLTQEDLAYDPGNGGRTLHQTLNHFYNMLDFAGRTVENKVTQFPEKDHGYSFSELRQKTLDRIEEIKLLCLESGSSFIDHNIKLEVNGNPLEVPFWHFLNGPLIDTFYHLGQVVCFRRALGKPIDPHVQPFFGKRMEA